MSEYYLRPSGYPVDPWRDGGCEVFRAPTRLWRVRTAGRCCMEDSTRLDVRPPPSRGVVSLGVSTLPPCPCHEAPFSLLWAPLSQAPALFVRDGDQRASARVGAHLRRREQRPWGPGGQDTGGGGNTGGGAKTGDGASTTAQEAARLGGACGEYHTGETHSQARERRERLRI